MWRCRCSHRCRTVGLVFFLYFSCLRFYHMLGSCTVLSQKHALALHQTAIGYTLLCLMGRGEGTEVNNISWLHSKHFWILFTAHVPLVMSKYLSKCLMGFTVPPRSCLFTTTSVIHSCVRRGVRAGWYSQFWDKTFPFSQFCSYPFPPSPGLFPPWRALGIFGKGWGGGSL